MPAGYPNNIWRSSGGNGAASHSSARAAEQASKAGIVRIPGSFFEDSDTEEPRAVLTPPSSIEQASFKSTAPRNSTKPKRTSNSYLTHRVSEPEDKIDRLQIKLAKIVSSPKKGPESRVIAQVEQGLEQMYKELSKAEKRLHNHESFFGGQEVIGSRPFTSPGGNGFTFKGRDRHTGVPKSTANDKPAQMKPAASAASQRVFSSGISDDDDAASKVVHCGQSERRSNPYSINFTTEDTLKRPDGIKVAVESTRRAPTASTNLMEQFLKATAGEIQHAPGLKPRRFVSVSAFAESTNSSDTEESYEGVKCGLCSDYGCDRCKPDWFDTLLHDEAKAACACGSRLCSTCHPDGARDECKDHYPVLCEDPVGGKCIWCRRNPAAAAAAPADQYLDEDTQSSHASSDPEYESTADQSLRASVDRLPQSMPRSEFAKEYYRAAAEVGPLIDEVLAKKAPCAADQDISSSSQGQVVQDGHDFAVVATVLFDEVDDNADLPPPALLDDVLSQSLEQTAMVSLSTRRIKEVMHQTPLEAAFNKTQESLRASGYDLVTTFMHDTRGEFLSSEAADVLSMCHGQLPMAIALYKSAGAAFVRELLGSWQSKKPNGVRTSEPGRGGPETDDRKDDADSDVVFCNGCAFGCESCYPMMKSTRYKNAQTFTLLCPECDRPRVFVDRDGNSECLACEWYKPVSRKDHMASSATKKTHDTDKDQDFVMPSIDLNPYARQKVQSAKSTQAFAATAESVTDSDVDQGSPAKGPGSKVQTALRQALDALGLWDFVSVDQTTLYHRFMACLKGNVDFVVENEQQLHDHFTTILHHQNATDSWFDSLQSEWGDRDVDEFAKRILGPISEEQNVIAAARPDNLGDWWSKSHDSRLLAYKHCVPHGPWSRIAENLSKSVEQCEERYKVLNSAKAKAEASNKQKMTPKESTQQAKKAKTEVTKSNKGFQPYMADEVAAEVDNQVFQIYDPWPQYQREHARIANQIEQAKASRLGGGNDTVDRADDIGHGADDTVKHGGAFRSFADVDVGDNGGWDDGSSSVRWGGGDGSCMAEEQVQDHIDDTRTTAEPASTTPQTYKVTYWATVECGDHYADIRIDSKDVSGPEKRILDGPAKKVWKWIQDKGLTDRVSLKDAFDLAKEMDGSDDEAEIEERSFKSPTPVLARSYVSPSPILLPRSSLPFRLWRRGGSEVSQPNLHRVDGGWESSGDDDVEQARSWGTGPALYHCGREAPCGCCNGDDRETAGAGWW